MFHVKQSRGRKLSVIGFRVPKRATTLDRLESSRIAITRGPAKQRCREMRFPNPRPGSANEKKSSHRPNTESASAENGTNRAHGRHHIALRVLR